MQTNKNPWRLIIDEKPRSAAMNMAIDEAILLAHRQCATRPTLRLYQWEQPTLSLGYFQKVEKDIDLVAVKRNNIALIRRMTGGRAVLHNRELTYSIVISEEYPEIPKGVTKSYCYLSEGLVKALKHLNIEAEVATSQLDNDKIYSAACYDAPSWYEILVQGKKIIGSAQVRKQGSILQHGSLPTTLDIDLLFSVLKFKNEEIRQRMKQKFLAKAIAINEARGIECSINEIQDAIITGFADALSIEFQIDSLTAEELSIAESLYTNKYGTTEWDYGM